MSARRILIIALSVSLILAVSTGVVNALGSEQRAASVPALSNVRAYTAAPTADHVNYAVDGSVLFAGEPGEWFQVETPADVIVSAAATDLQNPEAIYMGAANEMAIYRSVDGGEAWMRIPLTEEYVGGVTDIAFDSVQRILYVGTDTAGLFRLRDVGSSVTLNAQLLLDEPVLEVAADSTGAGLAFARTEWHLYRAENFGTSWVEVDSLQSVPTAVEIANSQPATIYVGTVDRGLLESQDGLTWTTANEGLGMVPGSRLQVDALAVDPMQPEVVYVSTSYVHGTTTAHAAPVGVSMSTDGAEAWSLLSTENSVATAALLPVSGQPGSVYALTSQSRTPLALGNAPVQPETPAVAETTIASQAGIPNSLAWITAIIAALLLIFAVVYDLRSREPQTARGTLASRPVRIDR